MPLKIENKKNYFLLLLISFFATFLRLFIGNNYIILLKLRNTLAPNVSKQDARVLVDIANFLTESYSLQYFQIHKTKLSRSQADIFHHP